MMKLYFLPILLLSSSAFALSIAPYVNMQDSLASDDFNSSMNAHKIICETGTIQKNGYKDCEKKFKDIEELRTSFKALSEVYIAKGDKTEMSKLQKATCPMAKAKWIQKPGSLRNPYYGKSMLDCGTKI